MSRALLAAAKRFQRCPPTRIVRSVISSPRNRALVLLICLVAVSFSTYLAFRKPASEEGDTDSTSLVAGDRPGEVSPSTDQEESEDPYAVSRERMVSTQIEARNIRDRDVLDAMRKVPRHRFVPSEQVPLAYEDTPLPIGYGQTISQPYIVGLMTEALELNAESRVLEVGTGSGYQAAILSQICAEVYSIEIVQPLAERSSLTLEDLGYSNVEVVNADGYYGWEDHAPFDAVIITCAASHIPPYLVEQLKDGGRLILPLGSPFAWSQTLTLLDKDGDNITTRHILDVRFVPMTGAVEGDPSGP
jgi:protein-L-isoaspartate(D-aspartate) O-methyltransferase